jgi:hypothetical protein
MQLAALHTWQLGYRTAAIVQAYGTSVAFATAPMRGAQLASNRFATANNRFATLPVAAHMARSSSCGFLTLQTCKAYNLGQAKGMAG